MNITVNKMERSEHCGDWHDKPLKWIVNGPNAERQKFSTKKEALSYKFIRSKSPDEFIAQRKFILS